MTFTARLAAFGSALFLAGATYAASHQDQSCPDVGTIKSEGLSMAIMMTTDTYLTYHMSQYNTDQTWIFGLAPVHGGDEDEALQEGNAMLYTLSGDPSPQDDNEGYTFCLYDSGNDGVEAFAIHADQLKSPYQLRRFLHK